VVAEEAPLGVQLWPAHPGHEKNLTLKSVTREWTGEREIVRWVYEGGAVRTFELGEEVACGRIPGQPYVQTAAVLLVDGEQGNVEAIRFPSQDAARDWEDEHEDVLTVHGATLLTGKSSILFHAGKGYVASPEL